MNKSKIKAIKLLARQLPKSKQLLKASEIISGEKLLEEDNTLDIEPKSFYKRKGRRVVHINHYKRLKKAWNKDKEQGLADYIIWLDENNQRFNEAMKQREEQIELERVDAKLLEISKGDSSSFWKNLVAFLYSFFNIFGKKEAV